MSTIAELIERLEKATGPNYEIERQITEVTGYPNCYRQVDGTIPNNAVWPNFTGSIDAAAGLCEHAIPGWQWLRKAPETMTVYRPPENEWHWAVPVDGAHALPAIVLCIAVLKGHQLQQKFDEAKEALPA